MGFTDKMCYEISKDIINNFFWKKYIITVKKNQS